MRSIHSVLIMTILVLLSGCSEDPADRAAAQVQQETSKALEQYSRDRDIPTTRQQLDALSRKRADAGAQDPAILSAANMQLATAYQEQSALILQSPVLNKSIESVEQILQQLSDSHTRLEDIRNLLGLSDAEIADIDKHVESDLKPRIAQVQNQVNELVKKRQAVQQEFQRVCDTMLKIEAESEENLRQAQAAAGDLKAQLEKAGFDLKSQKKEYYIQAQEAENTLAQLDSELAILQPHLKRLETNLKDFQEKLSSLKTSSSRSSLQAQYQDMTNEISRQINLLKEKTGQLKNQFNAHQQQADKIIASIDETIEKYQQIRSRQLNPTVSMSLGQAYSLAGSVLASKVYTASDLGWRMEGIFGTYQSSLPEGLSSPIASAVDTETAKKAMQYFDLAAEQYENAESAAGQLREGAQRDGAQKAACAALKGRLLAIHNKIRLADRIKDFSVAEEAQTKLEQAKEKTSEYGAFFSQSATAMLLSKGIDFTPILPVDSAIVLEGIKKDFTAWRALRGPDAEKEVEQLLTHIDQLQKEYPGDEQINQFLTQERQEIEAAKTKGFAPEPEPEASPQDANSV